MQTPSTALVNTDYYIRLVWATTCYTHAITVKDAHAATTHFRPTPHLVVHSILELRLPDWWHPSSRTTTGAVWVIQHTSLRVSGWLIRTRQGNVHLDSDGSSQSMEQLRCWRRYTLHSHPQSPHRDHRNAGTKLRKSTANGQCYSEVPAN